MKMVHRLKEKVVVASLIAFVSMESRADNTLQLTNISGSTGAGTSDISSLMTKGSTVAQNFVNFMLIAAAAVGVAMVCASLYGIWKAQKDQRESPKVAVVGLIVGALMTSVALVVGLLRNTVNVS
jgi:hypothetical protein